MSTNTNIAMKMKNLREKAGLNQTQVANFLGIDQSYISKLEKGERPFNLDVVEKLCDLFGCTTNEIMSDGTQGESLSFAFRADVIENEDLVAIAEINRIALNLSHMKKLLEVG